MKKYKHIPTGTEVIQYDGEPFYAVNSRGRNGGFILSSIVESGSDWQEIKESAVPPGIISFLNTIGTECSRPSSISYESWVRGHLFNDPKSTIHTILVDGVEWSVGEKVKIQNETHIIDSFNWSEWGKDLEVKTQVNNYWLSHIEKLPVRKPICTLKDENGKDVEIFEGDKVWYVKLDWGISSWKMDHSRNKDNFNRVDKLDNK